MFPFLRTKEAEQVTQHPIGDWWPLLQGNLTGFSAYFNKVEYLIHSELELKQTKSSFLHIPHRFLAREEEGAVFSECQQHVLWAQELPERRGEEGPRGLRRLRGRWLRAPGLPAPGPPEEEEEAAGGEDQRHGPWKGEKTDREQLPLHRLCAEQRGQHTRFLNLL